MCAPSGAEMRMLAAGCYLLLLAASVAAQLNGTKHCDGRGGCSCDCSWAPKDCGHDDGTCCYSGGRMKQNSRAKKSMRF